ncbi:MAG: hypothetical protein M0R33_07250 [Methylomonas sp.]|jgi:hypothetical protein|uniref:hypothetical protein n=1 Tax=Methylomonas sp. TaxID=418 RepID=UPI0025CD9065|nr:hypothetical protein [Methylomonas sp.]MCK9606234.1 hypothetical protein [Methylomonas sp.]
MMIDNSEKLNALLDEMSDLCEHWKRWRNDKGHTPAGVGAALVILAQEVATYVAQLEAQND